MKVTKEDVRMLSSISMRAKEYLAVLAESCKDLDEVDYVPDTTEMIALAVDAEDTACHWLSYPTSLSDYDKAEYYCERSEQFREAIGEALWNATGGIVQRLWRKRHELAEACER